MESPQKIEAKNSIQLFYSLESKFNIIQRLIIIHNGKLRMNLCQALSYKSERRRVENFLNNS